jgi:hypothetical protein
MASVHSGCLMSSTSAQAVAAAYCTATLPFAQAPAALSACKLVNDHKASRLLDEQKYRTSSSCRVQNLPRHDFAVCLYRSNISSCSCFALRLLCDSPVATGSAFLPNACCPDILHSSLLLPPSPPQANSQGGGAATAAGQAVAEALTSGQPEAQAYASALATATASGGCGAVSNVLASAEASAQASGKGDALAQALAQSEATAVSQCLIPACSTKPFARNCCTNR